MNALHTFHIPVMGLAYTIDTPIKVARFGISSVISIIEDNLVEKMRGYYYPWAGETYHPIPATEPDSRAKRITNYLNLVNRIVMNQMKKLRKESFTPGSELTKYFEMLPTNSEVSKIYKRMVEANSPEEKQSLQARLRWHVVPGNIDVNIMTKLDKNNVDAQGNILEDGSDAVAALRGYANSDLSNSSIILSAGMNPRLFSYMEKLDAFDADREYVFKKKIVIKVSDYRSALIQGKMLAKKGLWVSEFRIESGLNCGGHAFASDGYLLGPILEDFKQKRKELHTQLFETYTQALKEKGKPGFIHPHPLKITVQGGIGTHEEDEFLQYQYGVDGTGWGTPFLLVPEATTVDDHTLQLLSAAKEKDVVLSKNSPLGIRFHYLKGTTGEQEKFDRINRGLPGSPCTEKFLVSNTEFTSEPICTASRTYQKRKIEQLQSLNLPDVEYQKQLQEVLDKECLCIGLSNAAIKKYKVKPFRKLEAVNICPGPNIAYFSEVVSLQRMIDHIYGRVNLLINNNRPHMFIKELSLYVDYWHKLVNNAQEQMDQKKTKYVQTFYQNILSGIAYYRDLADKVTGEMSVLKAQLEEELDQAEQKLKSTFQNQLSDPVLA
jgi:hypothetical protein